MKKVVITLFIGLLVCFAMFGCKKIIDKPVECWNSDWLIGTWEGTTPSSISPFAKAKIRIVFRQASLADENTLPGGSQQVWSYDGTLTWDVDGDPWSMDFKSSNFPQPDYNVIIWSCMTMSQANTTVNNISLRIGDEIQTDIMHSIDLDWGPANNTSGDEPKQLDFYGDVEIDNGDDYSRADYPPQAGSMITLKKK